MRALVAGALSLLLAVPLAAPATAQDDNSVESVMAEVVPYTSQWNTVPGDIAALTTYSDQVRATQASYVAWWRVLQPRLVELSGRVDGLAGRLAELQAQEQSLQVELTAVLAQQAAQQRKTGAIARLLYQQPSPELSAVAQVIDGEDLRAFERQDLVMDVLESATAELERIKAEVARVQSELDKVRADIERTNGELADVTAQRDAVAAKDAVVDSAMTAIAQDLRLARGKIDVIRKAEEERLKAAAAAAAAAEQAAAAAATARARSAVPARPTGGGAPAHVSGSFSALLPAEIPYRQVFLTYGLRYRVEPSLLAAIASQESNFNAWAGCDREGAGKGIMQHENQQEYCGPDAVPASVEKAAQMLAKYYDAGGHSWPAAVFAFNNGPGLLDEWVAYSDNRDEILSVLAAYYDRQPYATPGPKGEYSSWGQWRARVAYSYAAPDPLPGFRSATQKWLIYRQG